FDFSGDARNHDVATQPDSGLTQRTHALHVAGESTLHVRDAEPVHTAVLDESLRLEAPDPGEPRLLPGVRRVHVAVEHERLAAARALQEADYVRPAILHLLPLHPEPDVCQLVPNALPHRLLVARWARNGHEVDCEGDEAVGVDLNGNATAPRFRTARSARAAGHPRARASCGCIRPRGTPRS